MANIFKFITKKILPIVSLFTLLSCGENHALKEETFYFEEDNASWMTEDQLDDFFLMVDNNGISSSFSLDDDSYYFGKGWSSFLGITTHISHTEYHYQAFRTYSGIQFSYSLTAGHPPFGDDLFIALDQTEMNYNFTYDGITRLYTSSGNKSLGLSEDGYIFNDTIVSHAEILDTMTVSGVLYSEVLHLQLLDFLEKSSPLSVTEIYVAKGIGLIQFNRKNGITYWRKND